ncbi:TPA: hypothetical protein QCU25_004184 [Bacillus anthracis]|uniref:hypothetical protein n=1 Tax=Bacillus cereus group sp. BY9-3LC TaxID=3018075 RepID=UPI0022DF3530|nr:hypothetical protein [Bacillus cereus group sp. BY9-3LC]MDA1777467.1 hypothetical protein [Bacillus cereus group sp. BY9-3LC]
MNKIQLVKEIRKAYSKHPNIVKRDKLLMYIMKTGMIEIADKIPKETLQKTLKGAKWL